MVIEFISEEIEIMEKTYPKIVVVALMSLFIISEIALMFS